MLLCIDVETVPNQHPEARAAVRAGLRPPGTLKKAESITAWWASEAESAAEDQYRKQALDGGTQGEIVSIACVNEDGQTWVRCRAPGDDEAELLREFFAQVEDWTRQEAARVVPNHPSAWPLDDHFAVGHNAAFDLGFLWRRAIVRRVAVPRWLPGPDARVGKDYGCTMWSWTGYGGRISLDALCKALGIESPKSDLDGSQVYDAWLAGECKRIADYNLRDAQAAAECWHRIAGRGRT